MSIVYECSTPRTPESLLTYPRDVVGWILVPVALSALSFGSCDTSSFCCRVISGPRRRSSYAPKNEPPIVCSERMRTARPFSFSERRNNDVTCTSLQPSLHRTAPPPPPPSTTTTKCWFYWWHAGLDLERRVAALEITTRITSLMFYNTFKLTGNKQTNRAPNFRRQLLEHYGFTANDVSCALLGPGIKASNVSAAHILRSEWAVYESLFCTNINGVTNGIFLYKPLEYAFDSGHISFRLVDGAYVCKVMNTDAVFRDKLIDASARALLGEHYVAPPDAIATLTFGELEGKPLKIAKGALPEKRTFGFMAWLAVKKAMDNGWLSDTIDPVAEIGDMWSDGWTLQDKVLVWLWDAAAANSVTERSSSQHTSDEEY